MKEAVLQRVNKVCRSKCISETQFAQAIGSNQKTINQQLKGERTISLDIILNISRAFEDISLEWLLRGKGEMILSSDEHREDTINFKSELEKANLRISHLEGQNEILERMVGLKSYEEEKAKNAKKKTTKSA